MERLNFCTNSVKTYLGQGEDDGWCGGLLKYAILEGPFLFSVSSFNKTRVVLCENENRKKSNSVFGYDSFLHFVKLPPPWLVL